MGEKMLSDFSVPLHKELRSLSTVSRPFGVEYRSKMILMMFFENTCDLCLLEYIWALTQETCLRRFANNTEADQPAHPCRLISAFVIRFLESIICKLATGEIPIF